MKVVVRVDASGRIGSGHLVRTLTLADSLRDQGAQVTFVCRDHPGAALERVRQRGFSVVELTAPEAQVGRATWLGVPVDQDAEESITALAGTRPDWLVVDHYGLECRWQQRLRSYVGRILVIDDLADRRHDCDLLVDQNHGAGQRQSRYRELAPEATALLGPRYALLDAAYRRHRDCGLREIGPVRRVLVFLSAADTPKVLDMIVAVLERLDRDGGPEAPLQVDLVMSRQSCHWQRMQERFQTRPHWRLRELMPNLAALLAHTDLAIGAGGATTWERLCLGVPSAAVILADNQRAAVQALAADGLLVSLGEADVLEQEAVYQAIAGLVQDTAHRRRMAQAGAELVDGLGAARVVGHMLDAGSASLRLQRQICTPGADAGIRYRWQVQHAAMQVATVTASAPGDSATGGETSLMLAWQAEPGPLPALAQPVWEHVLGQVHAQLLAARPRRVRGSRVQVAPAPRLSLCPGELHADRAAAQPLDIAVLSDADSWLNRYLPGLLANWLATGHRVAWAHEAAQLPAGGICFYLGCSRIVDSSVLARFDHNLVVHESDLPAGRGWSPLSWQILEGQERIAVTLFEAGAELDSGPIHDQTWLHFEGNELNGELKQQQFQATSGLCSRFIERYQHGLPPARPQQGDASYWPRRRASDSQLDPQRSLAEQFNLLRIVDNRRYPAWFDWRDHRYELAIRKRRRSGT